MQKNVLLFGEINKHTKMPCKIGRHFKTAVLLSWASRSVGESREKPGFASPTRRVSVIVPVEMIKSSTIGNRSIYVNRPKIRAEIEVESKEAFNPSLAVCWPRHSLLAAMLILANILASTADGTVFWFVQGSIMPQFSVIVPFLGDIGLFEGTLASVLRYRPDNTQVIVAHDGLFRDLHDLGDEVDFAISGRAAQLTRLFNCGIRHSEGEFIALIRPGIELDENWQEPIARVFADQRVGCVSPLIISPAKPSRVVAAGVAKEFGFRRRLCGLNSFAQARKLRRLSPLGPTSWAAFYRSSTLQQIGSFDEMLQPVYLDLDLALSISTLGFDCVFEPDCVVSIDRAAPLVREASLAHGRSAQRAIRRHSYDASVGATLLTITSELIRSPLQPWLIQHALQRVNAGRLADIDRHFADKLSRVVRHQRWEDQSLQMLRRAA